MSIISTFGARVENLIFIITRIANLLTANQFFIIIINFNEDINFYWKLSRINGWILLTFEDRNPLLKIINKAKTLQNVHIRIQSTALPTYFLTRDLHLQLATRNWKFSKLHFSNSDDLYCSKEFAKRQLLTKLVKKSNTHNHISALLTTSKSSLFRTSIFCCAIGINKADQLHYKFIQSVNIDR